MNLGLDSGLVTLIFFVFKHLETSASKSRVKLPWLNASSECSSAGQKLPAIWNKEEINNIKYFMEVHKVKQMWTGIKSTLQAVFIEQKQTNEVTKISRITGECVVYREGEMVAVDCSKSRFYVCNNRTSGIGVCYKEEKTWNEALAACGKDLLLTTSQRPSCADDKDMNAGGVWIGIKLERVATNEDGTKGPDKLLNCKKLKSDRINNTLCGVVIRTDRNISCLWKNCTEQYHYTCRVHQQAKQASKLNKSALVLGSLLLVVISGITVWCSCKYKTKIANFLRIKKPSLEDSEFMDFYRRIRGYFMRFNNLTRQQACITSSENETACQAMRRPALSTVWEDNIFYNEETAKRSTHQGYEEVCVMEDDATIEQPGVSEDQPTSQVPHTGPDELKNSEHHTKRYISPCQIQLQKQKLKSIKRAAAYENVKIC